MNDLTKTASAGALAALSGIKTAIAKTQQIAPRGGGDPFLKMDNHGTWMFGQDNIEVEEDSEWAVNPLSARHGFVCWKARPQGSKETPEKLQEIGAPLGHDLPLESELPDRGYNGDLKNEWNYFIQLDMRCMSGDDEGEQVVYNPSSKGGIDAILGRDRRSGLLGELAAQIDRDMDHPVPIVLLKNDSYDNKTYKTKTFVPVFEIVRWVSLDDATEATPEAPKEAMKTASEAGGKKPAKQTATEAGEQTRVLTPEEQEAADFAAFKASRQAQAPEAAPEPEQQAEAGGERRRRRRTA